MATEMNFEYPPELQDFLSKLDSFIRTKILPVQHSNDNNRFFDHRREHARTDWDNGGLPRHDWEELLDQARRIADETPFYRFALPKSFGGAEHSQMNQYMCAARYHMASHPVYGGGVSLANDLQNEHSVIGNFPQVLMLLHFGTEAQRAEFIPKYLTKEFRMTFGLTETSHGSDATHMDTRAVRSADGKQWTINGNKMWQTGMHTATHMLLFARTSGSAGGARGITCFIVPTKTKGVKIESFEWTFNMPTDHATVSLTDVVVGSDAVLGEVDNGLAVAQTFVHENRIRQAASSCGSAKFCIDKSVEYAKQRKVFGEKPLSANQAIQWPLVELATQVEMLRLLILRTGWEMDRIDNECKTSGTGTPWVRIEKELGGKIAMCNYWANRLCTEAADRAIQVSIVLLLIPSR